MTPNLLDFVRQIVQEHHTNECSGVDGDALQHIGTETGVLVPVDVTEPCGLDCQCAYFGAFDDEGSVAKCYRLAPELRARVAALESALALPPDRGGAATTRDTPNPLSPDLRS